MDNTNDCVQDEVAVYWDVYPTQAGDLNEQQDAQEPGHHELHQQLEPTDPVLMEAIYIVTRVGTLLIHFPINKRKKKERQKQIKTEKEEAEEIYKEKKTVRQSGND